MTPTSEHSWLEPVEEAVASAARFTGIPREQIEVLEVNPVDWPDASLGLPEPGMMYAQAITPGFQVWLRAGERTLVYHTDSGRRVIRAPVGRRSGPWPGSGLPDR